jgi:protocatechuate 3,4-dioxygenase beta subunit
LANENPGASKPNGKQAANPAAASGKATSEGAPLEKRALHLSIDDRHVNAVRGGKLVLTGRAVEDGERGVAGLRVEVWIVRQERQQRMLLAVQVSDTDGYFRADFGVPPDLAVGDYRLIVRSDGDAQHLPGISD